MTFDWEGRTAKGQHVSGTQEGTSTHDVLSRLQAQGITVTRVEASAVKSSGTVDFAARLEGQGRRREPKWPKALLLVCLVLLILVLAFLFSGRAAG